MANILITGGSGGIGTAITACFIANGDHVTVSHNNKSKAILADWLKTNKFPKSQVDFISCDVCKVEECRDTLKTLLRIKEIDVLINNAGITDDSTFLKMSFNQWHDVIYTNLIGLFSITQVVAEQMVRRGSGNIINISSINGLKGQFGQTNYSASKAGILGFTRSLALELASKGVRVNSICPGYTMTPMTELVPSGVLEEIKSNIPTGRLVNPKEIGVTALFIVNSLPSLTGETISLNGGHLMS